MRLGASSQSHSKGRIFRPFCMQATRCIASLACITFLAAAARLHASSPHTDDSDSKSCTLRVLTDGLRNAKGVVGTLLFTSSDGWPDDVSKSYRHEAAQIEGGAQQTIITLHGIAPGDYAIVVLHDENKNMKLDKNMFGWPKEGFGFANNPHIGLGAPPFRQALLHVACPATMTTIHILYK